MINKDFFFFLKANIHYDFPFEIPSKILLYPLYTGRLFHCYTLDKSIFHFGSVRSFLSLIFYF